MQPIVERFITQGKVVERASSALPPKTLCRADYKICGIGKKNRNNRVYEKAVWEKVLGDAEIKEKLANKSLFFHAEHPTTTQSSGEKIAGVVTGIRVDESTGDVFATMDVLETPYGQIVDTLLQAGCGIGVSTRADGELEEAIDEAGARYHRVVPESYRFVTVDFTADPSSFGSEMPIGVQRNVVGAIKAGLDNEKIDRQYATVLLEHLNCSEAVTILESIKIDEKHPGCKCLPTEKACKNCKHSDAKEKIKLSPVKENVTCPTCGGPMIGYNDSVICPKCTDMGSEEVMGNADPAIVPQAPLPVAEATGEPIIKAGDKVKHQGKTRTIKSVNPEDMVVEFENGEKVDVSQVEDFIAEKVTDVRCTDCGNTGDITSFSLDQFNKTICPACKSQKLKWAEEVKEGNVDIGSKAKQFLEDNWSVFIDDQDKIDNVVRLFKVTPEQAQNFVAEIENKRSMSDVFAMASESWQKKSEILEEKVKNLSAVIDALKESKLKLIENQKSVIESERKRNEATIRRMELQNESTKKDLNLVLEANQNLIKEQEAKIVNIKEQHKRELIKSYVGARTKALRLNLAPKALTILESCDSHDDVEAGIRDIQDHIREGLLQSNIPGSIVVEKTIPVDPKMHDINNKVAKAFRSFGA